MRPGALVSNSSAQTPHTVPEIRSAATPDPGSTEVKKYVNVPIHEGAGLHRRRVRHLQPYKRLYDDGMLVQNIYHDCDECGNRERLFSASPGYVVTAKGACRRCNNAIGVKLGLVTPFSVEILSLTKPDSKSRIFADQIRHRLIKYDDDPEVKKLSELLPDDEHNVPVHLATMATLLWLIKDQGAGEFRAPKTVDVHYVNANSARERATVLQQIMETWAPLEQAVE